MSEPVPDPARQLSDLVCYLTNLADDLQQWVAHGSIDPEVLPRLREELRENAGARHRSTDLDDPGAFPSAPPGAPSLFTARRSRTRIRR